MDPYSSPYIIPNIILGDAEEILLELEFEALYFLGNPYAQNPKTTKPQESPKTL